MSRIVGVATRFALRSSRAVDGVERRNQRRGSRFLDHHVARQVDGRLEASIDASTRAHGAPGPHEEVLTIVSCFGTQHSSDMHLGDDGETLALQREPSSDHGFVVTLGHLYAVAVFGHLLYGNAFDDDIDGNRLGSMPLLAVPNISEGRDRQRIGRLVDAVEDSGARILDLHHDRVHNRSVITATAAVSELIAAMTALAVAASDIDLTRHEGVHPRLGGLDVCPFVPVEVPMSEAVRVAHEAGRAINHATDIPIYFYGEAAEREEARHLSSVRRGGLPALRTRAIQGFGPDIGSAAIDPRRGVICVGARRPLIAFNVWLECDPAVARWIASRLRASSGGLAGVQALGLTIDPSNICQVSMNLTDPEATGIEQAFDATQRLAAQRSAVVLHTEIVGLVHDRYLPAPDATATRLLIKPGRSLETALGS